MKKIVIFTRGLQASGKSSWAIKKITEDQTYKRISCDYLRHMLSNYKYTPENEIIIDEVELAILRILLDTEYNIIIDEVNLNTKELQDKINLITLFLGKENVDIQIKHFPVSVEDAISRDAARPFSIGENAIRETYEQYKDVVDEINAELLPV